MTNISLKKVINMNEKVMVNEKLKCILYTIFSNYNNLSKKIYIVLDPNAKVK